MRKRSKGLNIRPKVSYSQENSASGRISGLNGRDALPSDCGTRAPLQYDQQGLQLIPGVKGTSATLVLLKILEDGELSPTRMVSVIHWEKRQTDRQKERNLRGKSKSNRQLCSVWLCLYSDTTLPFLFTLYVTVFSNFCYKHISL